MVVFGNEVLVEEAEGLFGGCGGEPDGEGVDVRGLVATGCRCCGGIRR